MPVLPSNEAAFTLIGSGGGSSPPNFDRWGAESLPPQLLYSLHNFTD